MAIRKKAAVIGWVVAAVIVVIVAVVVTFAVIDTPGPSNAHSLTNNDTALDVYNQAADDLTTQLTTAQQVLQSVDDNRIADAADDNPSEYTLQDAIDAAPVVPDAPPNGTAQLQADAATFADATAQLSAAVDAVQTQQISWARIVLDTAISQGQLCLASWDDPTDTRVADLQARLDAAQTLVDGLDGADPAAVGQQAWQAALDVTSTVQQFGGDAWYSALGVILPGDVDTKVIQGEMPSDVVELPADESGMQIFQTPGADVGCASYADSGIVTCEVANRTWTIPPVLSEICDMGAVVGSCNEAVFRLDSDGIVSLFAPTEQPPWAIAKTLGQPIKTLQYGQVVDWDPLACLIATDGVTCWEIHSFHGFKISPQSALYW